MALNPMLVKIARLLAKQTGAEVPRILNLILKDCLYRVMSTPDAQERAKAGLESDAHYCRAEGLRLGTFRDAALTASLKRVYLELRQDWRGY
jgi:hypothetical protein